MAFYNVNIKAVKESAVQGPDDIGVDLDQVEKDIAGPDGIEAHRDEVEDAKEGLIGEPLEEAFDIMYEAEYNYNQIMRCIGVQEISEASYGRDLVLEAADVKGFFAKVKGVLTNMFKRITETVKDVLSKLDFQLKADKKFLSENNNRKKIEAGAKMGKWEYEGYNYGDKELSLAGKINNTVRETVIETFAEIDKAENDASANERVAKELDSAPSEKEVVAKIIKDYTGLEADDLSDMTKKLVEELRGEKIKMTSTGNGNMGKTVCDVLAADRETTKIRAEYKNIKAAYAHDMKVIADMEKAIATGDKYTALKIRVANDAIKTIKTQKNVMHSVYAVYMKVARAKRAQYRAMAHFFLSTYEKTVKKPEVQHNSAGIFGDIKMI